MDKAEVCLNKPILAGASVLGLSSICTSSGYGNKTVLCYIDTNSFIYSVRTEDIYQDML